MLALVEFFSIWGCSSGGQRPEAPELVGAAGADPGEDPPALHLPFAVDDHFVTTGFMGDGVDAASFEHDDLYCLLPRLPAAQGHCHRVRYFPASSDVAEWAGLYWQNEPDNWGEQRGLQIPKGARRVAFLAASEPPGLEVLFLVGGIDSSGMPHRDGFRAELEVQLEGEYQRYAVDLSGASYDAVIGGFGIVVTREAASLALEEGANVSVYVDDIQWR